MIEKFLLPYHVGLAKLFLTLRQCSRWIEKRSEALKQQIVEEVERLGIDSEEELVRLVSKLSAEVFVEAFTTAGVFDFATMWNHVVVHERWVLLSWLETGVHLFITPEFDF